jgi:hypothetical protein
VPATSATAGVGMAPRSDTFSAADAAAADARTAPPVGSRYAIAFSLPD